MQELDLVKVNFNPESLKFLNALLGLLMFGVALDIKLSDFKKVFETPKPVLVGLLCQYLFFPAATILLIYLFKPSVSVGLGMVLVSACPSGNMANYMTHRAKANVALSVTLNTIIVLFAAISTPLVYQIWSKLVPNQEQLTSSFSISFIEMLIIITQLIVIPLILGVFLNEKYPRLVEKIRKPISILSLVIFLSFIIGALIANWNNVVQHLGKIFIIVLIHNALGLFIGFYTGKIFGLNDKDCQTLSIESSLHNTALGLILIFNFFGGLGGMAMIAAWYGVWDLIVPFGLTSYWRHKNSQP